MKTNEPYKAMGNKKYLMNGKNVVIEVLLQYIVCKITLQKLTWLHTTFSQQSFGRKSFEENKTIKY